MKVGVKYALIDGVKTALKCAPVKRDGEIWLPTAELDIDCSVKKEIDCAEYGALSSLRGLYSKYDEMGLIILDADSKIADINRKDNLNDMTSLMSSFIFEIETVKLAADYAPATAEELAGFARVGASAVKRGKGKGHPVIYADRDKFAKLKSVYEGPDTPLKSYICKLIDKADAHLASEKFSLNEDETGLKKPFMPSYTSEDGYDVGGRMGESSDSSVMRTLAFAYHMTGDVKYAKGAYYIGADLAKWRHWGPGHFLNCSVAMLYYALAYDWLTDVWQELGLDVNVIREGLFAKGIKEAYDSMIFDKCDNRTTKHTGWRFKLKRDNWNAVCNAGVIVGCIAFLADGDEVDAERREYITTLLGASLVSLMQDGFVLKQYAPDGSYVESNSYWSYGSNYLFCAMGALYEYFGTDFGIHDAPGMDKTCYYALNTESAEYVGWNYHDGSLDGQDTSHFNLVATVNGDDALYAVRKLHLSKGKNAWFFDVLYDPDIIGRTVPPLDSFPLDYYMEGIDGFTVRNGWERGSLFTAIIGGYNPQGASHNHIDSGAFVYHNAGKLWITDLGSDYYNTEHGYFGNYTLYRRNAEGHNVVFIKELESGQAYNATGKIVRVSANCDTPLAVIDNTAVYGGYAERAYRGMLVLNGRKTTVIQDEIDFCKECESFAAYHYKSSEIKAELSDGGRVCTMTHADGTKLTVRLLTENADAHFEIMNCYDYLLDITKNCAGEYSRDEFGRLVIKYGKAKKIRSAVAIELENDAGTAYNELIPIEKW